MDLIPVVYILHSGQLYGIERMTINTAKGLSHEYLSIILTPKGSVLQVAVEQGITTKCFGNYWDLMRYISFYLWWHQKLVFATTSVSQSILVMLCNLLFRRQIIQLHMVHGGSEEHLSYARKSLLNNLPIKLIAVSNYVRERLETYQVKPQKIKVIENFLLTSEIENGISGFQFNADDKTDLAHCLLKLQQISPELLNTVVRNAQKTLESNYSEPKGINAYRQLLNFS